MSRPQGGRGISSLMSDSGDGASKPGTGNTDATDAVRRQFDEWNPMEEDFKNDEFNSYNSGPGMDMQSRTKQGNASQFNSARDYVELYVTRIPQELSSEELACLFRRAGNVIHANVMPSKFEQGTTFGFVKFAKPEEAYKAIELFNNFKVGRFTLGVNIKLSKEEADKRRKEKQDNKEFERQLEERRKQPEMKVQSRELTGTSTQRATCNSYEARPVTDGKGESSTSGQQSGTPAVVSPTRHKAKPKPKPNVNIKPMIPKECHICKKISKSRCPVCKTPYCSRGCQEKDWNENSHKEHCAFRTQEDADFEDAFEVDIDIDAMANKVEMASGVPKKSSMESEILPIGHSETVSISHIKSPNDFTLVLVKNGSKMNQLRYNMEEFYESTRATSEPYKAETNEVCAVQFTGDDSWYRARINETLRDNKFKVFYVDYGNEEEVDARRIRRLMAQYRKYPAQAIKATLDINGIWNDPKNRWNRIIKEGIKYTAEALEVNKMGTVVKLVLPQARGDIDVSEFMVEKGFAVKGYDSIPVACIASPGRSSGSDSDTRAKKTYTSPTSAKVTSHPPVGIRPRSGEPIPHEMPAVVRSLSPRQNIVIKVKEFNSLSDFWVNVLKDDMEAQVNALEQNMLLHYSLMKVKESGFSLTGKMLYAVKSHIDDKWYRGHVYHYDTQLADVRYLDHGHTESVLFKRLQSLEGQHCSLPFQAVQCSLAVQSSQHEWPKEAKEEFLRHASHPLQATVVSIKDGRTVIEVIFEEKASPRDRTTGSGHGSPSSLGEPRSDTETKDHGHASGPSCKPVQGHPKSDESSGKRKPQGNHESTEPHTRNHLSHPIDTQSKSRHEVDPITAGYHEKLEYQRPDDQHSNCPVLPDPTKPHANHRPSNEGGLKPFSSNVRGSPEHQHKQDIPGDSGEQIKSTYSRTVYPVLSDLPHLCWAVEEEWARIKVFDAPNPDNLTIQIIEGEVVQSLVSMMGLLGNVSHDTETNFAPREGELVCAYFAEEWARAEVKSIKPNGQTVVKFVDYGNVDTIPVQDLVPITPELAKFPCFGVPASLADVSAIATEKWKQELLTEPDFLYMKVYDRSNAKLRITHITTGTDNNLDFIEEMIENGILVRKATTVEPTAPEVVSPVRQEEIVTLDTLQLYSLVRGEPTKVVVSDANTPDQITVQTLDCVEIMADLEADLLKLCAQDPTPYRPQIREIVCAKYSEDQEWYRGEVIDISEEQYRVRLVDYGTVNIVGSQSIRKLDPKLHQYKILGIKCRLSDTNGLADGATWDKEQLLGKPLMCRARSRKDGVYGVVLKNLVNGEMVDSPDIPSFGEIFVKEGILKPSVTSSKPSTPSEHQQEIARNRSEQEKSSTSQALNEENDTLGEEQFLVASDVPRAKLDPSNSRVMPCFIDGPHRFYVQIADTEFVKQFAQLEMDLTKCYRENEPPYSPRVSELVRVSYEYEGARGWYRAAVIDATETHISAFLIDYGNFIHIPLADVSEIKECHARIPRCAVHCSLWGMSEADNRWSGAAIVQLERQIKDRVCKLTIDNDPASDIISVSEIQREEDGLNVIDDLIKEKYISPGPLATVVPTSDTPAADLAKRDPQVSTSPVRPMVQTMKANDLPMQQIKASGVQVEVTSVYSPHRLYVNLCDETRQDMAKCNADIQKHCREQEKGTYSPDTVHEIVLARRALVWSRAEVKLINQDNTVFVKFVDNGKEQSVGQKDVLVMPKTATFSNLPCFAVPCSMSHTLRGTNADGSWTKEAIEWLEQTILKSEFEVKLVDGSKDPVEIDLYHKDSDMLISEALLEEGLAIQVADFSSPPAPLRTVAQPPRPIQSVCKLADLAASPFPKESTVCIVEITDPHHLSVQIVNEQNIKMLEDIIEQVHVYCDEDRECDTVAVGVLCCAEHPEGGYFRAVIEEICDDACRVFFLDFGDNKWVQQRQLKSFPRHMLSLPALGFEISIAGVSPSDEHWPVEVSHELTKYLSEERLSCTVVHTEKGKPQVKLVVNKEDGRIDVAQYLINSGMATKRN